MGGTNDFYYNERLEKERLDFLKFKNSICCEGNPQRGDNIWYVIMDGPLDSPYMGGKFKIEIEFKKDYPSSKPKFKFKTPICHINIDKETICLGSLSNYNEKLSITQLLSQIFMMLTSPNELSPFGTYKNLYLNDYSGYLKKAREMTAQFAKN